MGPTRDELELTRGAGVLIASARIYYPHSARHANIPIPAPALTSTLPLPIDGPVCRLGLVRICPASAACQLLGHSALGLGRLAVVGVRSGSWARRM